MMLRLKSCKPHNNKAREILTREYLDREYVLKERSAYSIARELGVHQSVVIRQLQSLGFSIRPTNHHALRTNLGKYTQLKYTNILTPEFLRLQYIEKQRSAGDIGRELGICYRVVLEYLRRYGFEIRGRTFYSQGERNSTFGKVRSEEWRNKISTARKGKLIGPKNHFWGKQHTIESQQLISDHHADFSLDKHPRWNGGKSFEPYTTKFTKELKDLIRLRDGYRCQRCGAPQEECLRALDIHHIDYDKTNCLPTNLISLCRNCNAIVNSSREYWAASFRESLNKAQIKGSRKHYSKSLEVRHG